METKDNKSRFTYRLHFVNGSVEHFHSSLDAAEFIDQFNNVGVVNEMGSTVYLTNPSALCYMVQV